MPRGGGCALLAKQRPQEGSELQIIYMVKSLRTAVAAGFKHMRTRATSLRLPAARVAEHLARILTSCELGPNRLQQGNDSNRWQGRQSVHRTGDAGARAAKYAGLRTLMGAYAELVINQCRRLGELFGGQLESCRAYLGIVPVFAAQDTKQKLLTDVPRCSQLFPTHQARWLRMPQSQHTRRDGCEGHNQQQPDRQFRAPARRHARDDPVALL